MAHANLAPAVDAEAFAALRASLPGLSDAAAAEQRAHEESLVDLSTRVRDRERACADTDAELVSLAGRSSNLPGHQLELRALLCEELGIDAETLPFAGELLDVGEAHAEWRGAAERVLRGFALSMLVPAERYQQVATWVNGRRLTRRRRDGSLAGARLVYERVAPRRVRSEPSPAGPGLTLEGCLEVKDGPFADYLRHELGHRADHRCAETLEVFRAERRAVTREGQIRSGERHEKDDRSGVDDPRTWVLGWVNERKIAALTAQLEEQRRGLHAAREELTELDTRRAAAAVRRSALSALRDYPAWGELDWHTAQEQAATADRERAEILSGSTALAEVERRLERNAGEAARVDGAITALSSGIGQLDERIERASTQRGRDQDVIARHDPSTLAAARLSYDDLALRLVTPPDRADDCAGAADRLTTELQESIERAGRELGGYVTSMVAEMNKFLTLWPELRSEMDADVAARADFRAYRERVAQDDLPRFEADFKAQLNTNTIRELAGFNHWLNRQADDIAARVDRINEAMGAIDYSPGRYIRLEKERTVNQEVQSFRQELRNATTDTITPDDDHYSERRFLDVERLIERFRGREGHAESDKAWTRRVTDVRTWFTFSASERDRESEQEWEHYRDSDGKSGGQKEKLAYTILAASLAYQFGLEWGVSRSRDFRFTVIDEAFGRGSDASTRYALELFAKLGLQLLIVTPLQKVHVIEPYVRAIGFVDNPTGSCSRLQTLTLEEFHDQRDRRP